MTVIAASIVNGPKTGRTLNCLPYAYHKPLRTEGQRPILDRLRRVTGRPGYAPGDLLKLYIYGYLNRVRSSRRLEAECHRNIEVIWLLRSLKPDFKTIRRRASFPLASSSACIFRLLPSLVDHAFFYQRLSFNRKR
jgi:Transposase domain (DUF772)